MQVLFNTSERPSLTCLVSQSGVVTHRAAWKNPPKPQTVQTKSCLTQGGIGGRIRVLFRRVNRFVQ